MFSYSHLPFASVLLDMPGLLSFKDNMLGGPYTRVKSQDVACLHALFCAQLRSECCLVRLSCVEGASLRRWLSAP